MEELCKTAVKSKLLLNQMQSLLWRLYFTAIWCAYFILFFMSVITFMYLRFYLLKGYAHIQSENKHRKNYSVVGGPAKLVKPCQTVLLN